MINNKLILKIILLFSLLFNIAVLINSPIQIIQQIIIFSYLIIMPGLLIILILSAKPIYHWKHFYYSLTLSLTFLMSFGLFINWILPLIGIDQPLRPIYTLSVLDLFLFILIGLAALRIKSFNSQVKIPLKKMYLCLLPFLFPLLSVLGAIRLNNGATNILTTIMLIGVLLNYIYLIIRVNKFPEIVTPLFIFCSSLALLLMTSLRGWFITGHDIQREYYVFQLTKLAWHWDISLFRDPYNACLSLTVLPTVLAGFLQINDLYVYKIFYQILFSFCPVAVYFIAKQLSNTRLSLLASLYFVSFPTFFSDMPMLNRQEIAFLLFASMILLLVDKTLSYKVRLMLFGTMGVGVIFAHYSTAYSMLLILGFATGLRFIFESTWISKIIIKLYHLFKMEGPSFIGVKNRQSLLIMPMLAFLFFSAFLWNVQITHTSRGVIDTIVEAAKSMMSFINEDFKSSDTQVFLFGGPKIDPAKQIQNYKNLQEARRTEYNPDELYSSYSYQEYPMVLAKDTPQIITKLGESLQQVGLNPYDLNFNLRQISAKILQIFMILGIFALFFVRFPLKKLRSEMMSVIITSVLFLIALIIIPVLSINYGLLRAFQQVLIVQALPIVFGSLALLAFFRERIKTILATCLACTFFLSSTGLIAEATGGYLSQLHLHNGGINYDNYYAHQGEVDAISWIYNNINKSKSNNFQSVVQAERVPETNPLLFTHIKFQSGIYPGLIEKNNYVLLGYTNINKLSAYALYKNEGLRYTYPIEFLDKNKNIIFNNKDTRIYK